MDGSTDSLSDSSTISSSRISQASAGRSFPRDEQVMTSLSKNVPDHTTAEAPEAFGLRISIVVLNYNTKDLLVGCLSNIAAQLGSAAADIEILVIDNCSTDGSVVAAQQTGIPTRTVVCDGNLGYTGGMNVGIAEAKSEYVCLVTTDVRPCDGAFETLLRTARQNQTAAIIGCKLLRGNTEQVDSAGGIILYPLGMAVAVRTAVDSQKPYEVPFVGGAFVLVRKSLVSRIGGFREDLFAYYDEVELCVRAWNAGFRVICEPRAVARHFAGGTFGQRKELRRFLMERNRLMVTVSVLSASDFLPFLLFESLYFLGNIAVSFSANNPKLARPYLVALAETLPRGRDLRKATAESRRANGLSETFHRQMSRLGLLRTFNMIWREYNGQTQD